MKKVIVWSGGADSTLLLARALYEAKSEGRETKSCVAAITLHHHQLSAQRVPMRKAEAEARRNFVRWAKKRDAFGVYHARFTSNVFAEDRIGQYTLWLAHLFPYAGSIWKPYACDKDQVVEIQFGYIKPDVFWHFKAEFLTAFDALAKLTGITWVRPVFPLEWHEKRDVLHELERHGVPRNAWWTCEQPCEGRPCGLCSKCSAVFEKTEKDAVVRGNFIVQSDLRKAITKKRPDAKKRRR